MHIKRVCVFCGSSPGKRPQYAKAAQALGRALVARKWGLVFGGGRVGLMGIVADAVREAGGEVIGVIPKPLAIKELAHAGLSDLRVVPTMHDRKALMAELSDAFIAMPGGFGTLEEFCEVLTWAQLGLHRKPCALLNVSRYFDPLLKLFAHATDEGFVDPAHRVLVLSEREPERLLEIVAEWQPPRLHRWVDAEKA